MLQPCSLLTIVSSPPILPALPSLKITLIYPFLYRASKRWLFLSTLLFLSLPQSPELSHSGIVVPLTPKHPPTHLPDSAREPRNWKLQPMARPSRATTSCQRERMSVGVGELGVKVGAGCVAQKGKQAYRQVESNTNIVLLLLQTLHVTHCTRPHACAVSCLPLTAGNRPSVADDLSPLAYIFVCVCASASGMTCLAAMPHLVARASCFRRNAIQGSFRQLRGVASLSSRRTKVTRFDDSQKGKTIFFNFVYVCNCISL